MVRTTPEAIDLQRTFAEMRDAGDAAVVMEVSSHALALHRADAIHWAVAIFTNLTQDHLDFHPDDGGLLPRQAAAVRGRAGGGGHQRRRPLRHAAGLRLPRRRTDRDRLAARAGPRDATSRATRAARPSPSATSSCARRCPGRFNVLNVLGAVAAVRALGVDDATIAEALPRAARAPGRFEPVDEGQAFAVLVDYAHTPDSLENVARAPRRRAADAARVIVVFGAGGDRDRAKRPLMGAVACDLADVVIVTSDNPRSEDPEAIIAAILAGAGAGVEVEVDRRAAIERAIGVAGDGDIVVIAGKGHEQGQEFEDGRKVPFDDVERRPGGAPCATGRLTASPRRPGARLRRAAAARRRPGARRHRLARGRRRATSSSA